MRRSPLIVAAILSAVAEVALAQDGAAAIRRLDSLWAQMYARQDTALALQLYADDLVFTSANGNRKTRQQELADVRPQPGLTMEFFRTTPSEVSLRDSTAVVSGVAEWRFVWNGQAREIRRTYTIGYARGGPLGWRIRTVQMGATP
jgi:ketosteroid isomerase-like protein